MPGLAFTTCCLIYTSLLTGLLPHPLSESIHPADIVTSLPFESGQVCPNSSTLAPKPNPTFLGLLPTPLLQSPITYPLDIY
jgi:hypothetical protein